MILGITGPVGSGKSTLLANVIPFLAGRGIEPKGIISQGLQQDGKRTGYTLINLSANTTEPLATVVPQPQGDAFTRLFQFYFYNSALRSGNKAIEEGLQSGCLFIDEIGLWELSGGGWSRHLYQLSAFDKLAVLSLRDGIATQLMDTFGFTPDHILRVSSNMDHDAAEVLRLLTL